MKTFTKPKVNLSVDRFRDMEELSSYVLLTVELLILFDLLSMYINQKSTLKFLPKVLLLWL